MTGYQPGPEIRAALDDAAPGRIEIDRSGSEPLVTVAHPPGPFTLDMLRSYASYLATVADEASVRPEPEVAELMVVIDASQARWLPYPESVRVLAGDILDSGYRRERSADQEAAPEAAGEKE
jgi:hypothetical protein